MCNSPTTTAPELYNKAILHTLKNIDIKKCLIKDENFYKNYSINYLLNTEIISINELQGEIRLSNGTTKVKYFIKSAMEEWGVRYILLVGGRSSQFQSIWYCPIRYVSIVDDWDVEYLSDLYFADIYIVVF